MVGRLHAVPVDEVLERHDEAVAVHQQICAVVIHEGVAPQRVVAPHVDIQEANDDAHRGDDAEPHREPVHDDSAERSRRTVATMATAAPTRIVGSAAIRKRC